MEGFCYHYDGTFAGFLCCVRDIYQYNEPPNLFSSPDDPRSSLYDDRFVETDQALAGKVYRRLGKRLGPRGLLLVAQGFLTCLPSKERWLCDLIQFGLQVGPGVEKRLDHLAVVQVGKAVRHLQRECELLTGFVRFSDYRGLLIGEITPKNQVLPILRVHFCDRLAGESFFLYDKTHAQLLLHQPDPSVNQGRGRWAIVPARDFSIPAPDAAEQTFRDLWRRFYDTLAIQSRYNPKCRQSHMPKRYWENMTELQRDDPTPPEAELPTLEGEVSGSRKRHTPSDPDSV